MNGAPVLVAGAGPVGLTAALALHAAGIPVRLIDAKPREALGKDPRAVAIAHGSRLILERLGLWHGIAATPIRHIRVSQEHGFGQTRIEAADYGVDALGYVVRLGARSPRRCCAPPTPRAWTPLSANRWPGSHTVPPK